MRVIPGLYEVLEGRVEISRIRDVDIEDLLGREPVQLEEELWRVPDRQDRHGHRRRRLDRLGARPPGAALRAARLVLVERSELALFEIDRTAAARRADRASLALADVRDDERMRALSSASGRECCSTPPPHKHVPMMEYHPARRCATTPWRRPSSARWPGSGLRGVRPDLDRQGGAADIGHGRLEARGGARVQDLEPPLSETRFLAVRFGNVLGSTGSVIPIFREQIDAAGR